MTAILLVTFAIVGLLIAGTVVLVIVTISARRRHLAARTNAFAQLAQTSGWQFIPQDDSLARRWQGPPFVGGGTARNVLAGTHRGWHFTAFDYSYTTTSYNGTTTTTSTHSFLVWTILLPAPVPALSVGGEGIFGGKIAEAFGFERLNTGDPAFDARFKIKTPHQPFGRYVLQPPVLDLLRRTGPWEWRFAGQTMISFQAGEMPPTSVLPRLELMIDVLERIPRDVWAPPPR